MLINILFIIVAALWIVFVALWIIGIVKDKRSHNFFGTSKYVWIGLIGLNACCLIMNILNIVRKLVI